MTADSRLVEAATVVLLGDDSKRAAAALEAAVLANCDRGDEQFDEQFDDLLDALSLYEPGGLVPYVNHEQLCRAIRRSPIGSCVEST